MYLLFLQYFIFAGAIHAKSIFFTHLQRSGVKIILTMGDWIISSGTNIHGKVECPREIDLIVIYPCYGEIQQKL